MIQKINILEAREALKILELQRLSYPIEADLIGSDAIPGLNETLEQLQIVTKRSTGFSRDKKFLVQSRLNSMSTSSTFTV